MVLPSLLFLQPLLAGEPVRFPKDACVLDITAAPYNAIANNGKDDTTAIQKAIGASVSSWLDCLPINALLGPQQCGKKTVAWTLSGSINDLVIGAQDFNAGNSKNFVGDLDDVMRLPTAPSGKSRSKPLPEP